MAIYHCNVSSIGKSTHQSGTASAHARYITRSGATVKVLLSHMTMPKKSHDGIPVDDWFDEQERKMRSNARVATKIRVNLPHELSVEQREVLVKKFCDTITLGKVPYLAAIHKPDSTGDDRNHHAHIAIVDRDSVSGKTALGLTNKGSVDIIREAWENHVNAALEAAGRPERVSRLSNEDRGIDATPTLHEGPRVTHLERKSEREAIALGRRPKPVTERRRENVAVKAKNQATEAAQALAMAEAAARAEEAAEGRFTRRVARGLGAQTPGQKAAEAAHEAREAAARAEAARKAAEAALLQQRAAADLAKREAEAKRAAERKARREEEERALRDWQAQEEAKAKAEAAKIARRGRVMGGGEMVDPAPDLGGDMRFRYLDGARLYRLPASHRNAHDLVWVEVLRETDDRIELLLDEVDRDRLKDPDRVVEEAERALIVAGQQRYPNGFRFNGGTPEWRMEMARKAAAYDVILLDPAQAAERQAELDRRAAQELERQNSQVWDDDEDDSAGDDQTPEFRRS